MGVKCFSLIIFSGSIITTLNATDINGDSLTFALHGLEAKEIMHIVQEDNTSAQVILDTPLDREVCPFIDYFF